MTQYGVCVSPFSESIQLKREGNAAISPIRKSQINFAFQDVIAVNSDDKEGYGIVAILKLGKSPLEEKF